MIKQLRLYFAVSLLLALACPVYGQEVRASITGIVLLLLARGLQRRRELLNRGEVREAEVSDPLGRPHVYGPLWLGLGIAQMLFAFIQRRLGRARQRKCRKYQPESCAQHDAL